MQLEYRLKQTSKTPTQSITEYMQDVKTVVDELAILGKKMDDEEVVDSILNGLDQASYKPILDAIHARDTTIAFNELHEKLINHELSLAQQPSTNGIHQPSSIFLSKIGTPVSLGATENQIQCLHLLLIPFNTSKEAHQMEYFLHHHPRLPASLILANANGVNKGDTPLATVLPLKRYIL
jgi:hypothetical protein